MTKPTKAEQAAWFEGLDVKMGKRYKKEFKVHGAGYLFARFRTMKEAMEALPSPKMEYLPMEDFHNRFYKKADPASHFAPGIDVVYYSLFVGKHNFMFSGLNMYSMQKRFTTMGVNTQGIVKMTEPPHCGISECTKGGRYLCTKCKLVRYCSKECQKQDWGEHKKSCNKNQRIAAAHEDDCCPL